MKHVSPVRALTDNYIWTIHDERCAIVVDPGEAAPALAFLDARGLRLAAILCTHHHADHVGGVAELLARWRVPVFGPKDARIDTLTRGVGEGDRVRVPELDLDFEVLEIPGHTASHIAFFGHGWLFSGDTLFSCGCGRLFEGTPAQMVASLAKLARLPDDTQVFCGHEYTLANIRFALAVDSENAALRARLAQAQSLAEQGLPTLPARLGDERAANPFLRCEVPAVRRAAAAHAGRALENDVDTFAAVRAWKNSFK